ncbi:hypothetical protein AAW50_02375 [Mycoplasmopsis canis]|uniref:hypothetical protein n=1 Tax=Mycoplasmopsis canis TaxID=29555 RepID=UPI000624F04F|nr:hypothetical protein [Mycoplasmopsis canis]AKF41257.1 hypothetical protein AAW50_02375 [Mycoplasmopsis canis]
MKKRLSKILILGSLSCASLPLFISCSPTETNKDKEPKPTPQPPVEKPQPPVEEPKPTPQPPTNGGNTHENPGTSPFTPTRTYDSVDLPDLADESSRFKSLRMTLKDFLFNVEGDDFEDVKQLTNSKKQISISFEVKVNNKEETLKNIDLSEYVFLTYKKDINNLEVKGIVSLPQQSYIDGKVLDLKEYKVKSITYNNKKYVVSNEILAKPYENAANIVDIYSINKKIYIEFDEDISKHEFSLTALKNGNKKSELGFDDLTWKVVKRKGADKNSVLEISISKNYKDEKALYAELNKIILRKSGNYHIYLFDDPMFKNDKSKLRINLKDDLKLVDLPGVSEESKRLRSLKLVAIDFNGVSNTESVEGLTSTPTEKLAKIIYGLGKVGDENVPTYEIERPIDILLSWNEGKLIAKGILPVPASSQKGNAESQKVTDFFIKSIKYMDKEYVFENPVTKNTKTEESLFPNIVDSYIFDKKIYLEFSDNIKSKEFALGIIKDFTLGNNAEDDEIDITVLTKANGDKENTILEIKPSKKLLDSETKELRLQSIILKDGDSFGSYYFGGLGNPDEKLEWKIK